MATKTGKRLLGKEKLLNILAVRSFTYAFLKRPFLEEATKEYLQVLTDSTIMEDFPILGDNKQFKQGLEQLVLFLRDPELLTQPVIDDLIADFTALFLGPQKMKAAPYESQYLSKKKLLFQEHTMEVREAYLKYDIEVEQQQRVPDDYIAFELDFMNKLTEVALKEAGAGRWPKVKRVINDQKDFFDNHLIKWAPECAEKVIDQAETDYFRGCGRMLSGFLTIEKELIPELASEINARVKKEKEEQKLKSV